MSQVAPSAVLSEQDQIREWEASIDVDRSNREVIKVALLDPGPYTVEEDSNVLDGLRVVDKLSDDDSHQEIKMTKYNARSPLLDASMCFDNEHNITYGKVAVTVHGASVLDLVASLSDYMSNFYSKHSTAVNRVESRILERINNHHQVLYYKGRATGLFQDRDFVWSFIVKRLSDDQYCCVLLPTHHKDAPITSDVVRATSTRVYRLTKISENATKMELFMTINMGGIIPIFLTNSLVLPTALEVIEHIYFLQIKPYADYDKAGYAAAMLAQMLIDALSSSSATAADRDAALRQSFIRTAALRHATSLHPWFQSLVGAFVNDDDARLPTAINASARGVRSLFVCSRAAATKRTLPSEPNNSNARKDNFVSVAHAEEVGRGFALCLSSNLTSSAAVDAWMKTDPALQQVEDDLPSLFRPFFVHLAQCQLDRSLGLTEEDVRAFTVDTTLGDKAFAETVGTLLMKKRSRLSTKQKVSAIYRYNSRRLNEMFLYPIMPSLLSGMISSGIVASSAKTFTTTLSSLTHEEAYLTGRSLGALLAFEQIAEGAVALWLSQHESMQELAEANPHFKPLAVTIARRQLMQAPWGMAFRVITGAVISGVDVFTDILAIARFFNEGLRGFAVASICMIGLCMVVQLLLVYLQNKRRGRARILKESLIVLTCLKPGVDAYRVCRGDEPHLDDAYTAFMEMILCKAIEM